MGTELEKQAADLIEEQLSNLDKSERGQIDCGVRVAELETVLEALIAKLDECNPHITSAFQMAFNVRGGSYDGPNYGEELKEAREALNDESV